MVRLLPGPSRVAASSFALVAASLCGACLPRVVLDRGPDAARATDGATPRDAVASSDRSPTPRSIRCGGNLCATTEECCFMTGRCFDPRTAPEQCPMPSPAEAPPGLPYEGAVICGANSHCPTGQWCDNTRSLLCLGAGHCASRTICRTSWGTLRCGCDGETYPDEQTMCAAGVRHSGSDGACGEPSRLTNDAGFPPLIYCGLDEQCPSGQRCCPITGRCYETTCAACCAYPPPGTVAPCVEDRHCRNAPTFYCYAPTCDGPGGCVARGNVGGASCGGVLDPVCGCNGVSYQNECAASRAGTRVASRGACDGG